MSCFANLFPFNIIQPYSRAGFASINECHGVGIAKFVKNKEIDLLVMGSVARSGVPGFFVGNTAEKIINHVGCSVLVLKPGGWKSPIK